MCKLSGCGVLSVFTNSLFSLCMSLGSEIANRCAVFFASGQLQNVIGATASRKRPVLSAQPNLLRANSMMSLVSCSSGPKRHRSYRTTSRYGNIVSKFQANTCFTCQPRLKYVVEKTVMRPSAFGWVGSSSVILSRQGALRNPFGGALECTR